MKNLSGLLAVLITFLCSNLSNAQNLIDSNDWIPGTSGNTDNYFVYETGDQNSRKTVEGPYGDQVTVWEMNPTGDSGLNSGFYHNGITVETTKSYRLSYWVRSSGNHGCNNYLGFVPYDTSDRRIQSNSDENGDLTDWPNIVNTNLANDKWFLVVGYIRPSSVSDAGDSGVYDPLLLSATDLPPTTYPTTDYIMPSGETDIILKTRSFLYSCGYGEKMFVYDPRIEEVNNSMPLPELLYGDQNPNTTGGHWAKTGSDINYSIGNVGIGTDNPGEWKLAVNGSIRSHEIKVETTNWPDYVFSKEYKLPTLEEIQKHIDEKGHLPNVPSAYEAETNGIELGEMNRLLLEKIEELTLYIINQEKRILELEQKELSKN